MANDSRVAVLIDADNVSPKYIKIILDEISKEDGVATYKRIYGDWTNPALVSWKHVLLYHREELYGFGHDYRRHGYPLFRPGRRLLPGVL